MLNKIIEKMNEHGYMSGVDRMTDRVKETAEVFTPAELVLYMISDLDLSPSKTVFDPACGDGQFLVAAKWIKVLKHDMSEDAAVKEIYGVDIMQDNVDLCKKRLNGGNIYCDDTLNPQTKEVKELLGISTLDNFFQW